jgi:mobilization protein NikA
MQHRITCSVTPQQWKWLTEQAKKLGLPLSEFLRRIIDQVRLQK